MKKKSVYSATTVALLVAAGVISSVPAEAATSQPGNPEEPVISSSAKALQQLLRDSPGSDLVGPAFGQLLVAQATAGVCQSPELRSSLSPDEFDRLCGCDDPELRTLLDPDEYGRLCGAAVGAFEIPVTVVTDNVC